MHWIIIIILVLLITAALLLFYVAGRLIDKNRNTSEVNTLDGVPRDVREIHKRLTIADWHSDNLLWDRDPLKRMNYGHVDVRRLIEGNVAVQVFDAVIKSPRGQNYYENKSGTDNITLLAIANRWPIKTWFSLFARAIHQSNILHDAEKQSDGKLRIITNQNELRQYLEERKTNPVQVAGLLAIEGLHALEGNLNNLQRLNESGYRIMGLTHFFDNKVGGSSSGIQKYGLTEFGKRVVKEMNHLSIVIDLAHASPSLIEDVVSYSEKPVIVTHTGVKAVYDSPRNLSDHEIRMIAGKGGLIGIGFWDGALGEDIRPESIVRSIQHVIEVAGIEHVSLGSDFDGSTHTWFDSSQLVVLTNALHQAGFAFHEIEKIMGMNQIHFLLDQLPGS